MIGMYDVHRTVSLPCYLRTSRIIEIHRAIHYKNLIILLFVCVCVWGERRSHKRKQNQKHTPLILITFIVVIVKYIQFQFYFKSINRSNSQ